MSAARTIHITDVMIYGFSETEEALVASAAPNKETRVTNTACFTDLLALPAYAQIVNVSATASEDLETLFEYYTEVGSFSETVILVGNANIPDSLKKKFHQFADFDALMQNLKFLLLSASRRTKRNESFSNTLSNAIVILSEIRKHPGTTTAQLAEKLEISQRSVQRYIETLRVAGEWIEYDTSLKGWKLTDGVSVLWGDL